MSVIKNIFILIWRIWFILWVFTSVVPLIPLLAIIISKEKWFSTYFKIARIWSKTLLFIAGFTVEIKHEQTLENNKSYLLCPNHTSMIDIMLLLSITKNPFVFVGKKELEKLPFFGYIYKRTSILVDRDNMNSRVAVFDTAKQSINSGLSLCIFPEGKVPDDERIVLDTFQNGAFRLAVENQIPIVPISFFDCKKRHSYTFFSGGPGRLRVKIHRFIPTNNTNLGDRNKLKNKTFQVIYDSLSADKSYMKSSKK